MPRGVATAIFAPVIGEVSEDLIERAPEIVEPLLAKNPLGRSGFPSDIANAALWLASSEANWVTGQAIVVDGGLLAGRSWSEGLQRTEEFKEGFQLA